MGSVKNVKEEQLKALLSSVYTKANEGASLQEVMKKLTNELPEIMRQEKAIK
ncbi:hypothetical protein [Virgibacillus sp. DJP39]|uniref:hypothetical protein n=1 Tax=Virgibacillus sp. DJP39 TaxID=3409790 RepID=UPI003BB5DF95